MQAFVKVDDSDLERLADLADRLTAEHMREVAVAGAAVLRAAGESAMAGAVMPYSRAGGPYVGDREVGNLRVPKFGLVIVGNLQEKYYLYMREHGWKTGGHLRRVTRIIGGQRVRSRVHEGPGVAEHPGRPTLVPAFAGAAPAALAAMRREAERIVNTITAGMIK